MTLPDAKNYKYCQDTLEMKKTAELTFLALGERLYKIREGQLYRPSWSSFHEFELEFKWQSSTTSRLINIYKKFVLEYKLPPEQIADAGGWTVISEVLPLIHTKEDAKEWLAKTRDHTRSDIRKDVKEARGKLPEQRVPNCKHPTNQVYFLRICKACGTSEQAYPDKGRLYSFGDHKH